MSLDNMIDELEDKIVETDREYHPVLFMYFLDLMQTLADNRIFVIESTSVVSSEGVQFHSEQRIDRHLGSLIKAAYRTQELSRSAHASWKGLVFFFLKLLLCVVPLILAWKTDLVWNFLADRQTFIYTSVAVSLALCFLWFFIVTDDPKEAATIGFSGLPLFWFVWFCFQGSVARVQIQLVLGLASIGYVVLFLTKLRLIQSLVQNLPVLSAKKHRESKAEYFSLYNQSVGKIQDILQKIDIAYQSFEPTMHSDTKQGFEFLRKYYQTLLNRFD